MKLKNKRIVAILAIAVLIISLIPATVSRAAGYNFTVSNYETIVGENNTIKAEVKLDNELANVKRLVVQLKYDATNLEAVNFTMGDTVVGMTAYPGSSPDDATLAEDLVKCNENGYASVAVIGFPSDATIKAGTLFTVEFKAKAGIDEGNYPLELAFTEMETKSDSSIASKNGTVKVTIPVEKVELDKTTGTLNVGEEEQLTATVFKQGAEAQSEVKWTSSNSEVATVDANGKVTAVGIVEDGKSATATITATAGGKTATYAVTVNAPLESIETAKTLSLLKGETKNITVKYNPTLTTDAKNVTWATSDNTVATVENGKVKGIKEGTATIIATVGTYTSVTNVTVKEIPLTEIKLTDDFKLYLNNSQKLEVFYNPENTTDVKTVTWKSSDSDVVSVDKDGNVKALKLGEATITATTANGLTDSVVITVPEVEVEEIEVGLEVEKIAIGQTLEVDVVINPNSVPTTEEIKTTYKSSDEKIATVDENGIIKGISAGKATITVSVNDKFTKDVEIEIVDTEEEPKQDEENNEKADVAPKTGDIAIGAFVVLAIVSLGAIVFIVAKKIRK